MPSPTEDDMRRIAETIDSLDLKNNIRDRDSFDRSYDEYLEESDELLVNENVRDKTFKILMSKHPKRIKDERIFKEAKGKSLEMDRRTTAKTIVKTKEEYIRRGASKVDLKGYDTRKERIRPVKKRERPIIGRVKGKIVYTEKVMVKVKGKDQVRYRDRLGRFASIKRE